MGCGRIPVLYPLTVNQPCMNDANHYAIDPAAYFPRYFATLHDKLRSVALSDLAAVVAMARQTQEAGRKLILAGNGGSAAMASHVAVDFSKAAGLRAINFNEADLLTCLANDYGYENWIAKALELYADPGDLVILISSSGQSPNMLRSAEQARAMNLGLITLSGFAAENPLRQLGDINLWVDSIEYNIVEMTHHTWLVAIVDYLALLGRQSAGL